MAQPPIPRRTLLKGGAAAGLTGLTVVQVSGTSHAVPSRADGVVVPWLDQPAPIPDPAKDIVGNLLQWEALDSRLTPNDEFFTVKHYNEPELSESGWRLGVGGRVAHPQRLSLAELRSLPRRSVEYTLECSGNTGLPFFIGGIGNARWTGTPLSRLLRQSEPRRTATEVVFWGADRGEVTIRDNPGVTGAGQTGAAEPDATGGLDLTITEQFARSMSLEEAQDPNLLLCYEMNGEPLPREHGFPLRLIAPGWYGVANVKWLTRIEVTRGRFQGRFMARDYVTFREERRDGETVWTFTSVGRDRLKSAPAKVIRRGDQYTVAGVAWGAPIGKVEVRIDDGGWTAAKLHRQASGITGAAHRQGVAWRFWALDWGTPAVGEHSITSRAFDEAGNVQPPPEDPFLASRRTFWENNGQITRRVAVT